MAAANLSTSGTVALDPGDVWVPELTVKSTADVLTAATVTVSVTGPSGTVTAPATATASTGVYTAQVAITEPGRWQAVWTVSGTLTGVESQFGWARRVASNVINVLDVRGRSLNKLLTTDDMEIEEKIEAALAEYEELIGPASGTVTETFDGGGDTLVLRQPVNAITAASYASGNTLTYTDLTVTNGIVRWGYGTAGRFETGRVSITYAAPALPANHREVIIADVAGYFEATQRGGGSLQAQFPGEGEYDAPYASTPAVLFPRIRALAAQYPVVA